MPGRAKAAAKTAIRKMTRALGYDLVPLAAGLPAMQSRLFSEIPTVIDVGANVGQYGERVRDLGFGGQIISFEPGREAFAILHGRAAAAGRWVARQCALGEASGVATLNVSGNSVSSSLLTVADAHLRAAPRSATVATEDVRISTLDTELRDVQQEPFYLKLDVQGFELPVLRGGAETLARTRAVQVEVSFDALYDGQTDWLDLCRFLQDRGFVVRYMEPGYEDRHTGAMLQADLLFERATG